jgi:hypothetical protein
LFSGEYDMPTVADDSVVVIEVVLDVRSKIIAALVLLVGLEAAGMTEFWKAGLELPSELPTDKLVVEDVAAVTASPDTTGLLPLVLPIALVGAADTLGWWTDNTVDDVLVIDVP